MPTGQIACLAVIRLINPYPSEPWIVANGFSLIFHFFFLHLMVVLDIGLKFSMV